MELINLILLVLVIAGLAGLWLLKSGWQGIHVLSFLLGLVWGTLFANYGHAFCPQFFPWLYADTMFIIIWLAMWLGSGLFASIPFILSRRGGRILSVVSTWLAIGMAYTAIDQAFLGPYACGPNSFVLGQDMTRLNPTYESEDVLFGSVLQRLGINPFTPFAGFIAYTIFPVILLLVSILLIGGRRVERLLFP